MKDLERWLERRARADERVPCLDDVFLFRRFAPYARYRLRLFFLRWLTAQGVHLVRVVILAAVFSRQHFVQLLLAEMAVGFASSFWWGALEPMRERVRTLSRQGQMHRVSNVIESWLTAAFTLAAITLIACCLWLLTNRAQSFGPFELYGIALFVRLALQFVVRTFHSGAYAMRRIYRPGWAVVAVDLVSFGLIAGLWPVAGAWALPIGTLAATVAGAAMTVHFTRRLYAFVGLEPRWAVAAVLKQRWSIPWKTIAACGLSYALMKLDAVLVFGLLDRRSAAGFDEIELFLLLFALSPTIQAGFDWAQLFYFDLKRLHIAPLAPLLESYRASIARLAWAIGIAFFVLGSAVGTLVYFRSLGVLYVLLAPFFVARSLMAAAQIQAFSLRRYGLLLGTGALWLAAFAAAAQVPNEIGKLSIIAAAAAGVYLALSRFAAAPAPQRDSFSGVIEWMQTLADVTVPVRIRSVLLRPVRRRTGQPRDAIRTIRWSQRQFARSLAGLLRSRGAVTIVPPDRIVWFELAQYDETRRHTIASLSGGVAHDLRETSVYPSGRAAALAGWREHGLEAVFGRLDLDNIRPMLACDLREEFIRAFPQGWIFTPGAPLPAASSEIRTQWRRRIISTASRFLAELSSPFDKSPLDVTALCVAGRLQHVFVVPRRVRSAPLRRWRRTILHANALATLQPMIDKDR